MSSRRAQVLLLLGLLVVFVGFRWLERREPWNSDDIDLFQFAVDASTGNHWVFGAPLESVNIEEAGGAPFAHPAFRVGLLPFGLLAIRLLGVDATAYYLVPLGFSLLGFCLIQWLIFVRWGPKVALVFAAIHLAWPFELEHASLFLTDLPAAACSILSLCLLDVSARRTGRARIGCAVLAGLTMWEVYLLRNNGLVLIAPAYLVFLWSRSTRVPALWAIAIALLGVLGQQAFLVYRGFDWGYDWRAVRASFAEYAPFLPSYSWGKFLTRQFTHQVSTFGQVTGSLASLLILGSLALHLCLLRFERQLLLRAVALFGLFAWLAFSFSIYERVPGGVRAGLPVSYRYVQPFAYSSLVTWAWGWCWLRQRAAQVTPRSAWLERLANVALPALLITFSLLALVIRSPETYRRGATQSMVQAIQRQLSRAAPPLVIAGTGWSLRVPRIFCCGESSRRVSWQELSPRKLGELVEHEGPALVIRDVPRELMSARYLAAEQRAAYREELDRIENILWGRYELIHVDETYALFLPRALGGGAPEFEATPSELTVAPSLPTGAPLLGGPTCSVSADGKEPSRTLVPGSGAGRPQACEYSWLADGRIVSAPIAAGTDEPQVVLRLRADYEAPLSLRVDVVQYGAAGVSHQAARLLPGTSYVPIQLHTGAHALYLVYRVTASGAPAGQVVRVAPAQWRAHGAREALQGL